MRQPLILLAIAALSGCVSPLPEADPQMAWVDLSTFTGKLVMAERLDNRKLDDGRYFQVTPGSHELQVRFDFEIYSSGMGIDTEPSERLCYLTVPYDHFQAGQRYRLEARSIVMTPSARLYDASGKVVARERQVRCLP